MVLFFFSCNCNNAFVSDYNIYTRKNNLGDKEFRISLKGQITNLVFLPSQRGLEHKDIYLRMVSNYSTISTQQQNSNIKVYAGTLVNKYRSQGTYTMYYGDKQVF